MKKGYIYILSNSGRTVLYIGVTNNLPVRLDQHKEGLSDTAFTSRYKCYDLLYYEMHENMRLAIEREKQLKNWHSDWKWNLIKSINPQLKDLSGEL